MWKCGVSLLLEGKEARSVKAKVVDKIGRWLSWIIWEHS